MTRLDLTEDDVLEFSRLVRWLTGVTLKQVDAAAELEALAAKYGAGQETPAAAATTADPDGWIPWTGGENPAPGKTVDVRFRSGSAWFGDASQCWDWRSVGGGGDIVAYRVLA